MERTMTAMSPSKEELPGPKGFLVEGYFPGIISQLTSYVEGSDSLLPRVGRAVVAGFTVALLERVARGVESDERR
jgi:hypothetical protein